MKKKRWIITIISAIILLTLWCIFFYYNFTCKWKYEACMKRTWWNTSLCPTHCNFYKYITVDHIEDYCQRFMDDVCPDPSKGCSRNCNDYVPIPN